MKLWQLLAIHICICSAVHRFSVGEAVQDISPPTIRSIFAYFSPRFARLLVRVIPFHTIPSGLCFLFSFPFCCALFCFFCFCYFFVLFIFNLLNCVWLQRNAEYGENKTNIRIESKCSSQSQDNDRVRARWSV